MCGSVLQSLPSTAAEYRVSRCVCVVLRRFALCCSVLQCVSVCDSSLHCLYHRWWRDTAPRIMLVLCYSVLQRVAIYCSVLQCTTACCSVCAVESGGIPRLEVCLCCVAAYCGMSCCVAVCFSVLQCAAACCFVFTIDGGGISRLDMLMLCYSLLQSVSVCSVSCSVRQSVAVSLPSTAAGYRATRCASAAVPRVA